MKLVVVGEPPVEITSFLARRRALGQDRFDEVWEGDAHCIADPRRQAIRWFLCAGGAYVEAGASPLLGVTTSNLVAAIDWPG